MSYNIEKKKLSELLAETDIRIPRIQRDYAQGRLQEPVKKIRRDFVQDLLSVVKGEAESLNLDFIYGSYQGTTNTTAFEPLDGQQRLTTLFLLHWLLGGEFKHEFIYATRPSSSDFFLFLKNVKADEVIREWAISNEEEDFSTILKDQNPESYRWQWQYDPTIQGALVMLDEIANNLGRAWLSAPHDKAFSRLNNISFEYLDLNGLGLSKSLYVKMNARGKQLSDFDLLKSTLEQDILRQLAQAKTQDQKEELLSVQKKWREKVDTDWIDTLWSAYAKEEIARTLESEPGSAINRKKRKDIATDIEYWLQTMLLVFISRQLFLTDNQSIAEYAYNRKVGEMKTTLDVYLQGHRRQEVADEDMPDIDYALLIEDIDAVLSLVTVGDSSKPKILQLPENSFIDPRKEWPSYLDHLTAGDRNVDELAILHAIIVWLKVNPFHPQKSAEWIKDFTDWTRFVRNVLLNNNNYSRLDSISDLRLAMSGIDAMVEKWFTPDGTSYISVVDRIAGLPEATQGVYGRLDNASINEEITKARMKVADPDWEKLITEAENRPYVWGQIRWLLSWAATDKGIDKAKFKDYSERFEKVRAYATAQTGIWRTAMFILNHTDLSTTEGRSFLFNNHRDYSVKRYLRYSDKIIGNRYKTIIDSWKSSDFSDDIGSYCNNLLENVDSQTPLWIRALCKHPELNCEDSTGYLVGIEKGHTCLGRRMTSRGGYNDPVLKNIQKELEKEYTESIEKGRLKISYYDSRQETPNRLAIKTIDDKDRIDREIFIQWGTGDNEYVIRENGAPRPLKEDELLNASFLTL